ncbi:DNA-binding protein (plasmid) [Oceanimonas smirnovii]|uniref:DNA-binding protein n=1 Tax=Oceanimonas smirnovii TaxID=264574 RepID=UPI003AB04D24
MMAGITDQDVFGAADALVANGQKPTQTGIREFLGGGSFATIGPALKKWRAALAEQHELAGVELPGELAEALQQLGARVWGAAIEAAESRLAGEREALAAARDEIEAEVQEHREAVQQLEAEAEQRIARIDELEQQHAAAMEAAAQQERRNAELTAALAAAQAATAAEVTKVEAVISERVNGLEARLADAQHTIERLTERNS